MMSSMPMQYPMMNNMHDPMMYSNLMQPNTFDVQGGLNPLSPIPMT